MQILNEAHSWIKIKYFSIPKPVRSAIEEFLRLFLIGLASYLVTGQELDRTIILSITLKVIDKLIHKYGQENDNEFLEGGLTRF